MLNSVPVVGFEAARDKMRVVSPAPLLFDVALAYSFFGGVSVYALETFGVSIATRDVGYGETAVRDITFAPERIAAVAI